MRARDIPASCGQASIRITLNPELGAGIDTQAPFGLGEHEGQLSEMELPFAQQSSSSNCQKSGRYIPNVYAQDRPQAWYWRTAHVGTVNHRADLNEVTRLFLLGRVRNINIIGLRRTHSRYLYDRLPIRYGDEMGHACWFGKKLPGVRAISLLSSNFSPQPMYQ